MPERPILTARWTDLLLLNFAVPAGLIARLAPPGTEPDLHNGRAYISIVGFRFHVDALQITHKLSQNHPAANRGSVADALSAGDTNAREIAAMMRAIQP